MKVLFSTLLLSSLAFGGSVEFHDYTKSNVREFPTQNHRLLSYHSMLSKVRDAVVNISTEKTVKRGRHANPLFNDPFFRQFFGGRQFNIPQERVQNSLGSGVIVSDDGYIVTNNHVVADADKVLVSIPGHKKEYVAKVIGTDPKSDVAVIKIEGSDFNAIHFFNSDNVKVGDVVLALGNPFGMGETVTTGIVSGLNRSGVGINEYEDFIQTDAPINPGNSGGALINTAGALIGINSAANMVKKIARSLIEKGKVVRAYLGVSIGDINTDLAEYYKRDNGALLIAVQKEAPAGKAGLKRGDLIIELNGKSVRDANDLKNRIGNLSPDSKVELLYIRDGKTKSVELTLGSMDGTAALNHGNGIEYHGMKIDKLSQAARDKLRIPDDISGVLITRVDDDAKARDAGFRRGDVIIQIDSKEIKTPKEFATMIKEKRKKRYFVYRNGVIRVFVL